jgi:hypothetical protein
MPKIRYLPAAVAAALLLSAAPAPAKDAVDTAAYPELASDVLLPPILAELKRTAKDPYPIRDFTLCPPRAIKLKDGKPISWVVMLSFNARGSFGGYEGIKIYGVRFRNGRVSGPVTATELASNAGIDGLINSAIAKLTATCPMIPDATIQQFLSGSTYRPN